MYVHTAICISEMSEKENVTRQCVRPILQFGHDMHTGEGEKSPMMMNASSHFGSSCALGSKYRVS